MCLVRNDCFVITGNALWESLVSNILLWHISSNELVHMLSNSSRGRKQQITHAKNRKMPVLARRAFVPVAPALISERSTRLPLVLQRDLQKPQNQSICLDMSCCIVYFLSNLFCFVSSNFSKKCVVFSSSQSSPWFFQKKLKCIFPQLVFETSLAMLRTNQWAL